MNHEKTAGFGQTLILVSWALVAVLTAPAFASAQVTSDPAAATAKKEVFKDQPTLNDVRGIWMASTSSIAPLPKPMTPPKRKSPYGRTRDIDSHERGWANTQSLTAPEPPPLPIRLSTSINFDLGSSNVSINDVEKIRPFAQALAEVPERRLLVVGHTDSTGRRATNIPLSNRRAEAVKQVLIDLGVQPEQIRTLGKGPDDPNPTFADNDPRQRRVEFEGQ